MKEDRAVTYNIMVVGVGGQGVITLGQMFQEFAFYGPMISDFIAMESRGVSQREGSVFTAIKYLLKPHPSTNQAYLSPVPPEHGVDLMIALEPLEFLRNFHFCSPSCAVLLNTQEIFPKSALSQKIELQAHLSTFLEALPKRYPQIHLIADNFTHQTEEQGLPTVMVNQLMVQQLSKTAVPLFRTEAFQKCRAEFFGGR